MADDGVAQARSSDRSTRCCNDLVFERLAVFGASAGGGTSGSWLVGRFCLKGGLAGHSRARAAATLHPMNTRARSAPLR
jgi:hypothetical protein